jgi:hypothetical protein
LNIASQLNLQFSGLAGFIHFVAKGGIYSGIQMSGHWLAVLNNMEGLLVRAVHLEGHRFA